MKKKSTAPCYGRPKKLSEEYTPGWDYLERIEAVGPRTREGELVFRKRLAALKEARRIICEVWARHGGDREACAAEMGIYQDNLASEVRRHGLTIYMLDEYIATPSLASEATPQVSP